MKFLISLYRKQVISILVLCVQKLCSIDKNLSEYIRLEINEFRICRLNFLLHASLEYWRIQLRRALENIQFFVVNIFSMKQPTDTILLKYKWFRNFKITVTFIIYIQLIVTWIVDNLALIVVMMSEKSYLTPYKSPIDTVEKWMLFNLVSSFTGSQPVFRISMQQTVH